VQDTEPVPPADQAQALADWIRLDLSPGVGRHSVHLLLERYTTPQGIFSAGYAALAELVSPARARQLSEPPSPALQDAIAATLAWQAVPDHQLLPCADAAFPPLLRQIDDSPLLLYASGRCDLLRQPCIAIVGSRNASLQGKLNAASFACALSDAGLTVVSGLALGIDAAAHEGGLRGASSTIAVIGTGADRIYPRRNEQLARLIASQGCIVSEYPLGTPPMAANFPRRNRLISGLACAVLVVEAAAQSGSLITAHVAADQGRDVFAIPGSIHAPLAKGCHKLIKEGAKLVESVDDVLSELQLGPRAALAAPGPEYAGAASDLLACMGHAPLGCDAIAALTGMAPSRLAGQLLTLELDGQIERLPGGLFQRIKR
jgi:DNA processing protein